MVNVSDVTSPKAGVLAKARQDPLWAYSVEKLDDFGSDVVFEQSSSGLFTRPFRVGFDPVLISLAF